MDKITIKTPEEIELMRESGRLLAQVFTILLLMICNRDLQAKGNMAMNMYLILQLMR